MIPAQNRKRESRVAAVRVYNRLVRVCSWNIWSKGSLLSGSGSEPGPRRERHWKSVAAELAELDLDLIGLQEIDYRWGPRSDNADVASDIAEILGYEKLFSPSISLEDGSRAYGNAIFSREPWSASGRVSLSPEISWDRADHETEPRSAVWVQIEKLGLVFITLHLANAINLEASPILKLQLTRVEKLVKELAERFPGNQIILSGDFNLASDSAEIVKLGELLPRQGAAEPTWSVHPFEYRGWQELPPPRFAIDHIFSSKTMNFSVGSSELSDHLPIFAESIGR